VESLVHGVDVEVDKCLVQSTVVVHGSSCDDDSSRVRAVVKALRSITM